MFDNTKPNIIIISDKTSPLYLEKTLGPYKVAHTLRKHGYEVAVLHHASVFSWSEIVHTLTHMISDKTLFVGFNNFFYSDISSVDFLNPHGEETSDFHMLLPHGFSYNEPLKALIKSLNPRCKLVLGGPNAIDIENNKVFDYVVGGYSEMSVVNLAKHLEDSTVKLNKSYRSIFGPTIINDLKAEGYEFSGCDMKYTDGDAILPGETLLIEVARGCIFKCSFCSFPLNGKKKMDFIRNFDLLREELIDNYNRFGVTRYILSDDTVNDSPEKCQMLQELGDSLPFELQWHGYIRLDLLMAHPETVDMLYRGGMRSAFFGIETFNSETARAINKAGNKAKQVEFVRSIKERYGDTITTYANFICGLPYESVESVRSTVDFLMSDESPFDHWVYVPLSLKQKTNHDNYYSDLDLNFQKYGYTDIGKADLPKTKINTFKNNYINWKTDHMTLIDAQNLVREFDTVRHKNGNLKIHGRVAFDTASMLGNLEINKPMTKNFYELNVAKMNRAQQYKKLFWEMNGVPPVEQDTQYVKFTDWLSSVNNVVYRAR